MPHKDPEARRAYYRQWKRGDRKRLSNKYSDAARNANRRAARYGVAGRITTADARAVLEGAVCHYCGQPGGDTHGRGPRRDVLGLDHRIALAAGGANERGNLVAACHGCNASKFRADRPRPIANRNLHGSTPPR